MAKNKELSDDVDPLSNWYALQDALRACTEREAEGLLLAETKGKARERFMRRIHSRLNRLRAERERLELRDQATERIAS